MSLFHKLRKISQESEFKKSCNALKTLSVEQLNEMHDTLLKYVEEMPLPCLPGLDEERQERMLKKYNAFKQKSLPNGPVYGCRTYEEANELNYLIVKLLDELEE